MRSKAILRRLLGLEDYPLNRGGGNSEASPGHLLCVNGTRFKSAMDLPSCDDLCWSRRKIVEKVLGVKEHAEIEAEVKKALTRRR
jgi:hypothetical protein